MDDGDCWRELLNEATELSSSFKEIEEVLFDRDEIKKFRKPSLLTPTMMKKIYYLAEKLGNDVYLQHPSHKRTPKSGVNKDCFTFRYGAAVTFLGIRWISRGSRHEVKPERMRNDLIDTTLVAYSTYYDGLFTNDQDMLWLKSMTDRFLEVIP